MCARISAGGTPADEAIEQAQEYGLLGENILGVGLTSDCRWWKAPGVRLRRGDGSDQFVGRAFRPAAAPPAVPGAERAGGKPTNINNVETWYNITPSWPRAGLVLETAAPKAGHKVFRWSAR